MARTWLDSRLRTSLPELASCVAAARKGEHDIALGNVLGSNMFNLLAVLGLTGLVAPGGMPVSPAAAAFDIPVMIAVALLCLPIFFSGSVLSRGEGALFLACYGAYTVFLILRSQESPLLPIYQALLIYLLLPVTFLALLFVSIRAWRQSGNSSKL